MFYWHDTQYPDGTCDCGADFRWGLAPVLAHTYDPTGLSMASVVADVPLSDGTTVHVDLHWTPVSDRFTFGNDGPGFGDLPTHQRSDCLTANYLAHQKYRKADITGTISGVNYHAMFNIDTAIFNNWFHYQEATHGNC